MHANNSKQKSILNFKSKEVSKIETFEYLLTLYEDYQWFQLFRVVWIIPKDTWINNPIKCRHRSKFILSLIKFTSTSSCSIGAVSSASSASSSESSPEESDLSEIKPSKTWSSDNFYHIPVEAEMLFTFRFSCFFEDDNWS